MAKKKSTKKNAKKMSGFFQIKNGTYDKLKVAATIILPAIGALYATLAGIWGWGFGDQIDASISAIVAFINVLLGLYLAKSSADYHKGDAN